LMPYGVGTFGSRGTVMAGNAVYLAGQKLRDKILALASRSLHIAAAELVVQNGAVYRQAGTATAPLLTLQDLMRLAAPTSPY
ncbi:molybdopterin cofactor-binding domain-containing protein, partial [Salmonella sp. SAL4359]|uniref:molybdopterin cofactor-binding domain-containing protein n=1 Tax=Salmonella sp. SAL4359 TaxID=3159880 RepID=UPI00397A4BA9